MKTYCLIVLIIFVNVSLRAQDLIDVVETTFKVGAMGEEELYYGFAEGDILVFNFEEKDGKELKEIEIIELPNSTKFADFKSSSVIDKRITIQNTGVYQFRFNNGSVKPRVCKIKLQRIPSSDETKKFNTNWEWETIYDTTYVPYQEDSLVGYDVIHYTETIKELVKTESVDEMIMDKTQRVHSYFNENSSFTYLRVDLPQNKKEPYREEKVIAWAYWIGVGEESAKAYAQNVRAFGNLTSEVATLYGSPLAGIAVGALTEMLIPKTGEDVKYAFIADFQNVQAFLSGQTYYQFDQGKGIAAYGKNSNRLSGTFYIGLHNDNNTLGIDANVKIVVIKEIKTYQDIEYDRQRKEPKYVTLNKKRAIVKSTKIRVNAK